MASNELITRRSQVQILPPPPFSLARGVALACDPFPRSDGSTKDPPNWGPCLGNDASQVVADREVPGQKAAMRDLRVVAQPSPVSGSGETSLGVTPGEATMRSSSLRNLEWVPSQEAPIASEVDHIQMARLRAAPARFALVSLRRRSARIPSERDVTAGQAVPLSTSRNATTRAADRDC